MRDHDEGGAGLALQGAQFEAGAFAQPGIERAERLVEQQQPRPHHQAARQRDALLLPARKLVRAPPVEAGQPTMASAAAMRDAASARATPARRSP